MRRVFQVLLKHFAGKSRLFNFVEVQVTFFERESQFTRVPMFVMVVLVVLCYTVLIIKSL